MPEYIGIRQSGRRKRTPESIGIRRAGARSWPGFCSRQARSISTLPINPGVVGPLTLTTGSRRSGFRLYL